MRETIAPTMERKRYGGKRVFWCFCLQKQTSSPSWPRRADGNNRTQKKSPGGRPNTAPQKPTPAAATTTTKSHRRREADTKDATRPAGTSTDASKNEAKRPAT